MSKIGEDVLRKKASGLTMSDKERQEYEAWLEEQKQEKKAEEAEEIEGKEIKSKMPQEEPSDEQLIKAREQEMAEFARWKARKLKPLEDGVEEV